MWAKVSGLLVGYGVKASAQWQNILLLTKFKKVLMVNPLQKWIDHDCL